MRAAPDAEACGQLFEASQVGLLLVEGERHRIAEANGAAARLFASTPGALAGREVGELVAPASREPVAQLLRAIRRASGRPLSAPIELAGPTGVAIPVELTATAVSGGRAALALRDLRAERQVEEDRRRLDAEVARLERLQALGRLAGAVAHEMNNVLAVVMSVSSLALEEWSDHPAAADFSQILEAAQRARDLSQQLLGFIRTAPGKLELLEPDLLVHEVAGQLRGLSSGLVLVVEDLDSKGARVLGDPARLQQALLQLGVNAVDALGVRGGRVVLRSRQIDLEPSDLPPDAHAAPGLHVRIDVEDGGPGFSPDALAHAFEPFYTTKVGKGSGLGLATVQQTARSHGGFAGVASSPGRGARVTVHLPVASGVPAQPDAAAPQPQPAGERGLALVVDDEPVLRRSFQRLLERLGYSVQAAPGGTAAVDLVEAQRGAFALVLLDLSMPGMSGLEVAARLRTLDPSLPIVLMSGHPEERIPPEFLGLPATGFLPKPFTLEQFAEAVRRVARHGPGAAGPEPLQAGP